MANPGAQESRGAIRRIFSKGQAVSFNVRSDIRAARGEERPHTVALSRREHCKGGERSASQDADEHCLCAIILVMTGGDDVCADVRLCALERLPPRDARPRVQVRAGSHGDLGACERNAVRTRQLFGEDELRRGLGSQAVIHPMRADRADHPALTKHATYMQ